MEIEEGAAPNKDVTLIYPYYDNPNFLRFQIDRWRTWPVEFRRCVRLIVVDDCSPGTPAAQVMHPPFPFPLVRLFRIQKDVRWNWLAARNVGAHHANESWLLTSDMDHLVPETTIRNLLCGRHSKLRIYRFSRREHDGRKIHPHPNSWFYTREMYWRVGGYDETASGFYGSDGYYRRRCAATAEIRIMSCELERHEHIGDSSTTRYLRKQPEDAKLKQIMRALPPGSKPKVLSFPYEEIDLRSG